MATLDQAFIKAYAQARAATSTKPASQSAAAPQAPRIGLAAIGLRTAVTGSLRSPAPPPVVASPLPPSALPNQKPVAPVVDTKPLASDTNVRHIAPTIAESIHMPLPGPHVVVSLPSTPPRTTRPTVDDSESFALSLEGPRVPDLILADTFSVQEEICYCDPAIPVAGLEQSDLYVWHPTTRDLVISESDMVVMPRFAPQVPTNVAVENLVDTLPVDELPKAANVEAQAPIVDTEATEAAAPTNRSIMVPPPLPKTLIPPAPAEPVVEPTEADALVADLTTSIAIEAVAETSVDQPEIVTNRNEVIADEPSSNKASFAPLSSFNPRLVGEELRPQLEVDRFAWPEVCGLLLGRVEADFIRLAEEISARAGDGRHVIAWTGCQRGEGRTTSLLCMAQRLAALGRRCVLVDADFSRPELARRLGISAQVGWEEVVAGTAQLTDVLIGSLEDRIALLPRRQRVAAGTHPGDGPTAEMLFDMLRAAFDVVLLDVGPMAGDAELDDMASCAAAANVGGAYLVFDSRNTSNADMTATSDRLRRRGIDVWGAIENFHH